MPARNPQVELLHDAAPQFPPSLPPLWQEADLEPHMSPFDDYALANPCTHCSAQSHVRCATDCGKPHCSDPGGSYVIHCIPGDPYDTNTETRTG